MASQRPHPCDDFVKIYTETVVRKHHYMKVLSIIKCSVCNLTLKRKLVIRETFDCEECFPSVHNSFPDELSEN